MTPVPSEIIDLINKSDHFLGHIHVRPDADSVGAMLALRLGLSQMGKELSIYSEDEIPKSFSFLKGSDQIEKIKFTGVYKQKDSVYLFIDTAKWQLSTHDDKIPDFPHPLVNIDHHPDNTIVADISWIDADPACACEMVHNLLKSLEVTITPDIADCLLVGLLGDTYTFQNKNTNSTTFILASELLSAGASYQKCIFYLVRTKSPEYFRAMGFIASNLKISENNKFAWVAISFEDWRKIGGGSISELANEIVSSVDGTLFGAILAEKELGITKGSIRSRTDIDVSEIAHILGGGGHKAAAGIKIDKPIDKAEADFLAAVRKAGYN